MPSVVNLRVLATTGNPTLLTGVPARAWQAIGRQLFTLAAQSGAMPSKTQPRWVTGMRGKKSGKKTGARIFCRNGRAVFCIPSGLADGDTAEVATGIVFATQIATLLQQPEYRCVTFRPAGCGVDLRSGLGSGPWEDRRRYYRRLTSPVPA